MLVKTGEPTYANKDQGMYWAKKNIDQELKEELLVVISNTCVNPRTVMIHPCNASFTNWAVMTSWWFKWITFTAGLGYKIAKESNVTSIHCDICFAQVWIILLAFKWVKLKLWKKLDHVFQFHSLFFFLKCFFALFF